MYLRLKYLFKKSVIYLTPILGYKAINIFYFTQNLKYNMYLKLKQL